MLSICDFANKWQSEASEEKMNHSKMKALRYFPVKDDQIHFIFTQF